MTKEKNRYLGRSPLLFAQRIGVGFRGLTGFCEIQYHGINAVAEAGWRGPVLEYMSQVRITPSAHYLGPLHTMRIVWRINDASLANGLEKTRPATITFKFAIAVKQSIATYRAIIGAHFFMIIEFSRKGHLSTLLPGNIVHFLWQDLVPFLVADRQLSRV